MPSKTHALSKWCSVALFLFLSCSVFAQKTVTGRVMSSADKQAIPGATIQVKGTKVATQTGSDGSFTITSTKDIGTLIVTVVGFEPLQIQTEGRASVGDVTLSLSVSSLNDVVVTGYTAQKKKDITGSVAVVNVGDVKNIPAGNPENMLQGQASGVTIVSSGSPGAYSDIKIRGITSMGNINPLIIIDGSESINGIHDININDVESIQVLKDASAAIYGVRGSNGVVIVTTKKGKQGKAKITYDMYYGTQRPIAKGWQLANTSQTATANWAQQLNAGVDTPSHPQYGKGFTPVIPDYLTPAGAKIGDPGTDPSTYVFDPGNADDNRITLANKTGTDWFHSIFTPAPIQSHNITASGGGDRSSYLFSFNYYDQTGTLLNTYLKRYSVRANTSFNIKDHIRVGENAYVFYKDNPTIENQNEGNIISYSYREQVIIPIYDIKGNFAGTGSKGLGNSQNPYADAVRQANNRGNDWQIVGNVFAEADFLKHFTLRTQFGGTVDNYYYYYFSYTPYEDAEGNTTPNSYTEGSGYNTNWTWTNTLTYNNQFGKHNIKVLAGVENVSYYGRSMAASRSNYYSTLPAYWALNTGAPGGQTNSGAPYTDYTIASLFGRVDYAYNDKYLISATLRRDGSSVFASAVQYGTFPSIQGAWRISNEDFFKDVTFINDMKIRGSYGQMGSLQNVGSTNQFSLYNSAAGNSYYDINGTSNSTVIGFYQNQLGNTQTSWEKDIITNVGFDATLLHNSLDFTFDWYKKAVSGLLFQAQYGYASPVGAASAPYINIGNIQNTGIDFLLNYHGVINRDLKFNIGLDLTSYNNKIVNLPNPGYIDVNSQGSTRINNFVREQVGHPVGAFFGYKVIGLFQSAADVAKSPTQAGAAPGLFKYADLDGDGQITPADRTFIGNPNPKFTYGIPLGITFKNFDLNAFFYGSYGNDDFNYVKYWTDFPQVFNGAISQREALDSWTPTHTNTNVPILTSVAGFSNTNVVNSYYVEKGSFFKLKQLQIGYTIDPGILRKVGVDRFRIYVQAANLFTITKYDGLDPELPTSQYQNQATTSTANTSFGIDFGNYPNNQKSFLVGCSLSF
jgi:TonB-dependent starch-binding outer membrane protein SusC